MDGVELEILWSNLIGIVTERAKALQRIAFSPVVREAGDLACALFDRRGRMVAQANTGTPGHINSLAIAGAHLVRIFANNLRSGDVVTTNDPWLSAGHFFDITVLSPIFDGDRILAYIGSTIHHTDIGGYGIGAGARDVHEEGLWIPPLKLYNAGELCRVLHALIKQNVRTPDAVFGDLAAQVSSGRAASEQLIAMCRRYGLIDIEALSDEIISRSETATRAAIGKLNGGTFHGESRFDVPGGEIVTLKAAVTIGPDAGEISVDFAGSTPQVGSGINVVLNYTHAYSTFAIRSCLNPELPNNTGSLAPIKVYAPEGSILNCRYPAPVAARHVVGMYVPMPILKALYHVMPDRVLAEGSGAVWAMQIQGKRADGRPFTSSMFSYSGGMGARATKAGPSATCYPTGIAAVPVEIVEADAPVIFDRKELRPNSGGDGAVRGGDGQIIQFHLDTREEWLLNTVVSRVDEGPEGLCGGGPGAPGKFHINGKPVRDHKKLTMQPGDVVLFETPGGGGYGHRSMGKEETRSLATPAAPAAPTELKVAARTADLHMIDWESIPWEPVREGIVRKAFSGSGATLALHKLMPKHEPKPHRHAYEQIVYILAGHIRFHVGDKSVVLGPGGLLQIPPNVMHWGEVVGDEPVLNLDIFTPVREEYAPLP